MMRVSSWGIVLGVVLVLVFAPLAVGKPSTKKDANGNANADPGPGHGQGAADRGRPAHAGGPDQRSAPPPGQGGTPPGQASSEPPPSSDAPPPDEPDEAPPEAEPTPSEPAPPHDEPPAGEAPPSDPAPPQAQDAPPEATAPPAPEGDPAPRPEATNDTAPTGDEVPSPIVEGANEDEPLTIAASGGATTSDGPALVGVVLPPGAHLPTARPQDGVASRAAANAPGITYGVPVLALLAAGMLLVAQRRTPPQTTRPPAAGQASPAPGGLPARPPAGVDGVLLLGKEAVDRGEYEAAIQWFETALAAKPKLPVAHLCIGLCLLLLERTEQAADAFRTAASLDPDDPVPVYNLARALAKLGDHREAMALLAPVLHACPELAEDVRNDEVFEGLRDHPRFLQIIGDL